MDGLHAEQVSYTAGQVGYTADWAGYTAVDGSCWDFCQGIFVRQDSRYTEFSFSGILFIM